MSTTTPPPLLPPVPCRSCGTPTRPGNRCSWCGRIIPAPAQAPARNTKLRSQKKIIVPVVAVIVVLAATGIGGLVLTRNDSSSDEAATTTVPSPTTPTTTYPRDNALSVPAVELGVRQVQEGLAGVEEAVFDLGLTRTGIGEGPAVLAATCQPTLGDPVPVIAEPARDVRPMGGTALRVSGTATEIETQFAALSDALDGEGWSIVEITNDIASVNAFEAELSGVRVRVTLSPVVDNEAVLSILAEGDCITVP